VANKHRRFDRHGNRLPLPVRVPGTDIFTLREIEGEGRCKLCKQHKRLFSYDDESGNFCRIKCWVTYCWKAYLHLLPTKREIEEVRTRRAQK